MLRNTVSHTILLKSARPAVHICSKLSAPNARLCNICMASHAFLQIFSNYAWLAVHNPWPSISSLFVFPWPLHPSFFLKSQPVAHHQGFELLFFHLWIEVPEKSMTSLEQCNYECRRVKTVKLPDKKREEDG